MTTIGATNLVLNTNNGTNSGQIQITQGAASNIVITPNTTGDVYLESDTVFVGDNGAAATISTYGNAGLTISNGSGSDNIVINPASGTTVNDGNMILGQLNTNTILTTNGTGNLDIRTGSWPTGPNITLADGTNGAITLTPHGTGDIILDTDTVQIEQKLTTIGANNLILNTNNGTNSGEISITQGTGGNIAITPFSTGSVQMGAANTTATITTNGTGDLVINTNNGTNAGSITLTNGTNGNITLTPNGTGSVALTLADGGNLTNTRNYVKGALRNSTLAAAGEIWAVNSTGPVNPYQGISIDNSADNNVGAGAILRSYSNQNGLRGRVVFERARGSLASPAALQSGNIIGSMDATGYTSTGWFNDANGAVPAFFGFSATENWVSNTNVGARFFVSLAPTATTVTDAVNLITTIDSTPENGSLRSDRLTLTQGKTSSFTATGCSTSGTTLTIGTLVTGTIAVGNVITVATSVALQNYYIIANLSGSGSGSTWTLSGSPGTLNAQAITGNAGYIGGTTSGSVDMLADLKLLTNNIENSAGTTVITTGTTNVAFTLPVKFPVYTAAALTAITGAVGWQAAVSNSPVNAGKMAYWDTTNSRWSYIDTNTAV